MYIVRVIISNLILLNVFCIGDQISASFIRDYFKNKNIDVLTILSCWDLSRKASVMYELENKGFIMSYSITSINDFPQFRSGVLLDLSCKNESLNFFFNRISNLKLFGPHTEWLLVDPVLSTNITGIEYIKNSYILPGSSVILTKKSHLSFIYYDIYKTSVEKPLKLNIINSPKFIKNDRSNFDEATLHTGTVIMFPDRFKGWEDLDNPELDTWSKLHYPIIQNLAYQLNFKYTMIIESGYGWKENGSFGGLMGYLQREEIQFGGSGLLMREDRREIVDFTTDTFELRNAIIFKKPSLSTVSNIYILPFSRLVWIFCGLICILAMLFLSLEIFLYKYSNNYPFEKKASFADIATSILGFVCQQGSELYPKSYPARITTFIFSLSAIFIYTSYSANIVALLQSTSSDINTLVALSKSPLNVKIEEKEYNHILFREVSDKNVEMLLKTKVLPQGDKAYCSIQQGVAYLRTGHYAFNAEVNLGYKIISETFEEHEKCDLSELRLFFMPKLSVPVIKKSGYREIFAQKLSWQREAGIFKRIDKIWLTQRPSCNIKRGGYRPVGLTDFQPAIMALLYGISISFCLFILEIIITYRYKHYAASL